MSDEIGASSKLGGLLPADRMRDSGGNGPGQDYLPRKRKKARGNPPPFDADQEEDLLDPETDASSGKILDIVI